MPRRQRGSAVIRGYDGKPITIGAQVEVAVPSGDLTKGVVVTLEQVTVDADGLWAKVWHPEARRRVSCPAGDLKAR